MKTSALLKSFIVILLTSFCFSLLLLLFYRYDNKYIEQDLDIDNGVLKLTEDALKKDGICFLSEGWKIYPQQLLTPADFKAERSENVILDKKIGEYTDFSFGDSDRSPNGYATYRIVLSLPDTRQIYALALPEIFSAYQLYINDELMYTMGNPDPADYEDRISTQTVLFTGSDTVAVTLAVTDYSHSSSGLVDPPILGLHESVSHILNIRLFIATATLILILVCAIGSFSVGIQALPQKSRAWIFGLICVCLIGHTTYPIIFTFFTMPARPWYAFETLCTYGMLYLIVLLHNRIRHVTSRINRLTSIPVAVSGILFVLHATIPSNTQWINTAFEYSGHLVKLLTSSYLFLSSAAGTWKEEDDSTILLAGTTAFSISIIADKRAPFYNPYLGGWFPEYGGSLLCICLGIILCRDLFDAYKMRLTFTEEKRQLTRQLAIQKLHYHKLQQKIDDTIKYHHDERHHLTMMSMLLKQKKYSRLEEYLTDYKLSFDIVKQTILCRNLTIDALLQYYKYQCELADILLNLEIDVPSKINISDMDLSIIYGNLIENAYEACFSNASCDPYITIVSRFRKGTLLLRIENSISKPPLIRNGKYLSSKHQGYGIGIPSVRAAVANYDGQLKFDITDTAFQVSVIITEISSKEEKWQ